MVIGTRTIKTAIGTALAIWIAQQLGLEYFSAAGIITILCIQVTRKQTIKASVARIAACLLMILFAYGFFFVLGFHAWTIMLILLLFIPLLVKFKINEGFVTSSVILLRIYSLQDMSLHVLANEMSLLAIGVGVAVLMNLWMPSYHQELQELQSKIEHNFSTILKEYADYLRRGESMWDGKELLETAGLLDKGIKLAVQVMENKLVQGDPLTFEYFTMRERQFSLLERMMAIVSSLHLQVPQGEQIADYLEDLSNRVTRKNTALQSLERLQELRDAIHQTPLPQTREEFETRASLFYLLYEIEQYLYVKYKLWKA